MANLKTINFSQNKLSSIPYSMFSNISAVEKLDISSNNFTTFELWLIGIHNLIDCSNNHITHFTNNHQIDLSNYHFGTTERILFTNNPTKIDINDGILEMSNRCVEINSSYQKILMNAIKKIDDDNIGLLNWNCSCDQYYLQKYIQSMSLANFSTWQCDSQICNYQTSFDGINTEPRLCELKNFELCNVPELIQLGLCNIVSRSDLLMFHYLIFLEYFIKYF